MSTTLNKKVRRSGQAKISDRRISVRLTEKEYEVINRIAATTGRYMSDVIRESAMRVRGWQPVNDQREAEKVQQLGAISNNLSLLTRWAYTYKNEIETIEVLILLQKIQEMARSFQNAD